jgi:hypothetical protein
VAAGRSIGASGRLGCWVFLLLSPGTGRAASCRRTSRRPGRRPRRPRRSGRPCPGPASTRHTSRSADRSVRAAASVSSAPSTACTPLDCHHAPVSTHCATTTETFQSRPFHRNCSGPSTAPPAPRTLPLRTSTGSSYRRMSHPSEPCELLSSGSTPYLDGGGGRGHPRQGAVRTDVRMLLLTVHPNSDSPSTQSFSPGDDTIATSFGCLYGVVMVVS